MRTILISILIHSLLFSAKAQILDRPEAAVEYLQLFEDYENLFGPNKSDFTITEETFNPNTNKWKLISYSKFKNVDSNVIEINSGKQKFGFSKKARLMWFPRGSVKLGMLLNVDRKGDVRKDCLKFLPDTAITPDFQDISRMQILRNDTTFTEKDKNAELIVFSRSDEIHYFDNNLWIMTEFYMDEKLIKRIKKTHHNTR